MPRKARRITLYKGEQDMPGFPPTNAEKLREWLDGHLNNTPREFQQKLQVEFSKNYGYYDSVDIECEVFYMDDTPPEPSPVSSRAPRPLLPANAMEAVA